MYTVKTVGDIKYILYNFKYTEWAWVHGIYFVHPDFEEEFLRRLRNHGLI